MTDAISIDVPDELSLHARCVINAWLQHARTAQAKGDLHEMHRLGLVRDKINHEMARTRPCCEG